LPNNKSQAAHLLSGVLNIPQDVLTNKFQFREYVCLGFPEAAAGEIGRREGAEPEGHLHDEGE